MSKSLQPSDQSSFSEGLDFKCPLPKGDRNVWHKWLNMEGSNLPGIEPGCFANQLLAEHQYLFTPDEDSQLIDKSLVKPLYSALKRLGPDVLRAVYESLRATEDKPGARSHCKMADNLRECFFKVVAEKNTQPSRAIDSGSWPPVGGYFEGGEVEPDRRPLPSTLSQVPRPHGSLDGGDDGGDWVHTPAGKGRKETQTTSGYSRDSSGESCQSQDPRNWTTPEDVANFAESVCENMTGQELSTFANELSTEGRPAVDRRILKERIKKYVFTRKMSLYDVAIRLLGKNTLAKYVFEISVFTRASVPREDLREYLDKHLGAEWEQLALHYSLLSKTEIDTIKRQNSTEIRAQIDAFHAQWREGFPRFPDHKQTMRLLVRILCYASLRDVAKKVCEDLSRIYKVPYNDIHPDLAPHDNMLIFLNNPSVPEHPDPENSMTEQLQDQHHQQLQLLQQQQQQHRQEEESVGAGNGSPTTSINTPPPSEHPAGIAKAAEQQPVLMEIPIYNELDVFEDETQTSNLLMEWAEQLVQNSMYLVRQMDRKQAIHYAAELGYADLMDILLAFGHNGRAVMEGEKTPFLIACQDGHLSVVKMLIAQYGNSILKERDERGRTCLHFPQVYRNKELFQYLLFDLHANAIATTKTGVLPLSVAALVGDQQAVDHLLAIMDPNDTPVPSRMPPLHCAALANHIGIVKCLINSGFSIISDINSKSQDGFTALHIAAARGHLEIVDFLVKQDQFSVNEESDDGSTPLLLAAICNHPQIAKCLLYYGANMEFYRMVRKGVYHITPIGEAALGRNVEVAAVLMEYGANIMFKSGGTVSVLDHACIGGSEEFVRNLLPNVIERTTNGDNFSGNFLSLMKSAFRVSVTFENFAVARIILLEVMTQLTEGSEEKAFQQLLNTEEQSFDFELHSAIENYKELSEALGSELPNKGSSVRRVAGDRSSVLYYIGYDDGPHWGTEVMHLTLLFENLKMPMKFRSAYHRVYMEATNTVLNSVMRFKHDVSRESLATQALSQNSLEAAAFFNKKKLFSRFADPQEYVDQGQAGSTSGISMVCSMVSQQMLQDSFGMNSLTGDQYFMEVAKRNLENPLSCPYALKYSTPGKSTSGGSVSFQGSQGGGNSGSGCQSSSTWNQTPIQWSPPSQPNGGFPSGGNRTLGHLRKQQQNSTHHLPNSSNPCDSQKATATEKAPALNCQSRESGDRQGQGSSSSSYSPSNTTSRGVASDYVQPASSHLPECPPVQLQDGSSLPHSKGEHSEEPPLRNKKDPLSLNQSEVSIDSEKDSGRQLVENAPSDVVPLIEDQTLQLADHSSYPHSTLNDSPLSFQQSDNPSLPNTSDPLKSSRNEQTFLKDSPSDHSTSNHEHRSVTASSSYGLPSGSPEFCKSSFPSPENASVCSTTMSGRDCSNSDQMSNTAILPGKLSEHNERADHEGDDDHNLIGPMPSSFQDPQSSQNFPSVDQNIEIVQSQCSSHEKVTFSTTSGNHSARVPAEMNPRISPPSSRFSNEETITEAIPPSKNHSVTASPQLDTSSSPAAGLPFSQTVSQDDVVSLEDQQLNTVGQTFQARIGYSIDTALSSQESYPNPKVLLQDDIIQQRFSYWTRTQAHNETEHHSDQSSAQYNSKTEYYVSPSLPNLSTSPSRPATVGGHEEYDKQPTTAAATSANRYRGTPAATISLSNSQESSPAEINGAEITMPDERASLPSDQNSHQVSHLKPQPSPLPPLELNSMPLPLSSLTGKHCDSQTVATSIDNGFVIPSKPDHCSYPNSHPAQASEPVYDDEDFEHESKGDEEGDDSESILSSTSMKPSYLRSQNQPPLPLRQQPQPQQAQGRPESKPKSTSQPQQQHRHQPQQQLLQQHDNPLSKTKQTLQQQKQQQQQKTQHNLEEQLSNSTQGSTGKVCLPSLHPTQENSQVLNNNDYIEEGRIEEVDDDDDARSFVSRSSMQPSYLKFSHGGKSENQQQQQRHKQQQHGQQQEQQLRKHNPKRQQEQQQQQQQEQQQQQQQQQQQHNFKYQKINSTQRSLEKDREIRSLPQDSEGLFDGLYNSTVHTPPSYSPQANLLHSRDSDSNSTVLVNGANNSTDSNGTSTPLYSPLKSSHSPSEPHYSESANLPSTPQIAYSAVVEETRKYKKEESILHGVQKPSPNSTTVASSPKAATASLLAGMTKRSLQTGTASYEQKFKPIATTTTTTTTTSGPTVTPLASPSHNDERSPSDRYSHSLPAEDMLQPDGEASCEKPTKPPPLYGSMKVDSGYGSQKVNEKDSFDFPASGESFEVGTFKSSTSLEGRRSVPLLRQNAVSKDDKMDSSDDASDQELAQVRPGPPEEFSQCDVNLIEFVSNQVSSKWPILARRLDNPFSEDKIAEIKRHYESVSHRSKSTVCGIVKERPDDWKEYLGNLLEKMGMVVTRNELCPFFDQPTRETLAEHVQFEHHLDVFLFFIPHLSHHWRKLAEQLTVECRGESGPNPDEDSTDEACLKILRLWLEHPTATTKASSHLSSSLDCEGSSPHTSPPSSGHTWRHLLLAIEATTLNCPMDQLMERVLDLYVRSV